MVLFKAKKERGSLFSYLIWRLIFLIFFFGALGAVHGTGYVMIALITLFSMNHLLPLFLLYSKKRCTPFYLYFDDEKERLEIKYWYRYNIEKKAYIQYENLIIRREKYTGLVEFSKTSFGNVDELIIREKQNLVCCIRIEDNCFDYWDNHDVDIIYKKYKEVKATLNKTN